MSTTPLPRDDFDSPHAVGAKELDPRATAGARGVEESADDDRRRPPLVTAESGADSATSPIEAPKRRATLSQVIGLAPGRPDIRGDTRGFMLRRWLLFADLGALAVAFFVVEAVGGFDGGPGTSMFFDLALFAVGAPIWILLARAHNLYHVDSRRADHGMAEEFVPILQMSTMWSWSVLLFASATGLRHVPLSKLVLFWMSAFLLLLGFRASARAWARGRTWYLQNALIVGTETESAAIAIKLARHPEYGINVVACLELTGDGSKPTGAGVHNSELLHSIGPIPVVRGEVDVPKIVGELDVDRVVLASSVGALSERAALVSALTELSVHLDLVPSWGEVVGSRLELNEMEGMPLLTLPQTNIPRSSLLFKRMLDVTVSALALAFLSPLLAICALAIKLDTSGPVLFRQRRVGREGRRFELIKFLSMRADAEERRDEVADLTLHDVGVEGGIFKVVDDPRLHGLAGCCAVTLSTNCRS
nr:sugar transferase [Actinomycetota bacterium]